MKFFTVDGIEYNQDRARWGTSFDVNYSASLPMFEFYEDHNEETVCPVCSDYDWEDKMGRGSTWSQVMS